MKFIKEIRENLGINKYRIAKELGFTSTFGYTNFENSKRAVNLEKLIKLWRLSNLSAQEFLEIIESEVILESSKGK